MTISDWQEKHNISEDALADLQGLLALPTCVQYDVSSFGSEASSQQRIRLDAPKNGVTLWRNNIGAVTTDDGRHIRFGIANDSHQMNQKIKSSDLIGITPVRITEDHIGRLLGVFTAIECKKPGWRFKKSDKRAVAQLAYHNLVTSVGGFAQFATKPEDVWR